MKLLAWDTSSKCGVIAALEWDGASMRNWDHVRLISEWAFDVDLTHSERLLWGIHQILESACWKIGEVNVLGVGIGPGSFTGLRIGVTTARTLSHTLRIPLVGVSSLSVLTRPILQFFDSGKDRILVIACTDACKGQLFVRYGWARGKAKERTFTPKELMEMIRVKTRPAGSKWIVVGEGRARYLQERKELSKAKEYLCPRIFPNQAQGRFLGAEVWEAYYSGLAREGLEVFPSYLRASDAELKLRAGMLKASPVRSLSVD